MSVTTPLPNCVLPTSVVVPTGWRTSATCTVDESGIVWDGQEVAYDQITSVAYSTSVHTMNFVQRRIMRHLSIRSTSVQLEIQLARHPFGPRAEHPQQSAYAAMIASLHEIVEPRLRSEYLRSIAAGDTVVIGAISMNHVGMTHESDPDGPPRTWSQLPLALLEADHVLVESAVAGVNEGPWKVNTMIPNAVLLPELLVEAADAFC